MYFTCMALASRTSSARSVGDVNESPNGAGRDDNSFSMDILSQESC